MTPTPQPESEWEKDELEKLIPKGIDILWERTGEKTYRPVCSRGSLERFRGEVFVRGVKAGAESAGSSTFIKELLITQRRLAREAEQERLVAKIEGMKQETLTECACLDLCQFHASNRYNKAISDVIRHIKGEGESNVG